MKATRIKWTLAALGALLYLGTLALLLGSPGHSHHPPKAPVINGVEQVPRDSSRLQLTVSGSDFTPDVRAFLSLDTDNRHAIIGHLETWASLSKVVVRDGLAYLANGYRGVQIADVSDPTRPFIMGSVSVPDHATDLVLHGETAFVACSREGLSAIDVSDPLRPKVLCTLPVPGPVRKLTIAGQRAYCTSGRNGIQVIDISRPEALRISGALAISGNTRHIAIEGNRGVVCAAEGGLQLLDLTDPDTPLILDAVSPPGDAVHAVFKGNRLFVATDRNDIAAFDLNAWPRLVPLAQRDLPGAAKAIRIRENRAYISLARGGLQILDLSDINTLSVSAHIAPGPLVLDCVPDGNKAYLVAGHSGLYIIDLTRLPPSEEPPSPVGFAYELAIRGSVAYLADSSGALQSYDLSTPGLPAPLDRLVLPGQPADIKVRDNLAFVAAAEAGIALVDVSAPSALRHLASLPTTMHTEYLAVEGSLLAALGPIRVEQDIPGQSRELSRIGSRLELFDITDPTVPARLGSLGLPVNTSDVTLNSDLAYLANSRTGTITIVDLNDPTTPQIVDEIHLPWPLGALASPLDLVISEEVLWVANGRGGLLALNLADPSHPAPIGHHELPGYATNLLIEGGLAFVGLPGVGVALLDITDPAHPSHLTTLPAAAPYFPAAWFGGSLYLLDRTKGPVPTPLPLEGKASLDPGGGSLTLNFQHPAIPGTYTLTLTGTGGMAQYYGAAHIPANEAQGAE